MVNLFDREGRPGGATSGPGDDEQRGSSVNFVLQFGIDGNLAGDGLC